MKQLHTSQEIFKEKMLLDRNGNNVGEYACTFLELTGESETLEPHAQGVPLINMVPDARLPSRSEKSGYVFQIFTSIDTGIRSSIQDEGQWACAAWPIKYDKTGNACFLTTETGTIYRYPNIGGRFDGQDNPVTLEDIYGIAFDNESIGQGKVAFEVAK